MRLFSRVVFAFLLLSSSIFPCMAENKHPIAIETSFMSEAVSFPSFRVIKRPVHPGVLAAVEIPVIQFRRSCFFLEFNSGFYHHKQFQNGFFVGSDFGYNYTTRFGLGFGSSVGIGYLHTFYPGAVYEYNSSSGKYEQIRDYGQPHFMVSVALELSYNFNKVSKIPLAFFVQYRVFGEFPGISGWDIIAFCHTGFCIGIKYFLPNNKSGREK